MQVLFKDVNINETFYDPYSGEEWKKASNTEAQILKYENQYGIAGDYFDQFELVDVDRE